MGQDIYVGSLTRYYAQQWETPTQRWARESGTQYVRVSPGSDDSGTITDPVVVRNLVLAWMAQVSEAVGDSLPGPLAWDERIDSPYRSEQLHFTVMDGLRLAVACHEHPDLPAPLVMPENSSEEPALKHALEPDTASRFQQILMPTMWLPSEFDFTFAGPSANNASVCYGSSPSLARQLKLLNDELWQGGPEDLQRWMNEHDGTVGTVDYNAKWGFALLSKMTDMAVGQQLPMLLDF